LRNRLAGDAQRSRDLAGLHEGLTPARWWSFGCWLRRPVQQALNIREDFVIDQYVMLGHWSESLHHPEKFSDNFQK